MGKRVWMAEASDDISPIARGANRPNRSSTYLFINRSYGFASVLATFDVGKARDRSGNELAVNDEYKDFGFLRWADFSALASMALMYIIYLTIWIVHSPPVSQTSSVNRMDKCLKQVNVLEGSGMRSLIILFSCLVFFRPPIEASSAGQPWTGIPQNSMINAE